MCDAASPGGGLTCDREPGHHGGHLWRSDWVADRHDEGVTDE